MSRRAIWALDLVADETLIGEYEARHAPGAVWPEVVEHIRAQGVEDMEIWRTGDRLVMIATVADDHPRPIPEPPEIARWEDTMWRYQRPLPHAAAGEKWTAMARIFTLADQA